MGAAASRDGPLLQKRKFSPEERRELRKNVFYNPEEEYVSGIEHSADKVRASSLRENATRVSFGHYTMIMLTNLL